MRPTTRASHRLHRPLRSLGLAWLDIFPVLATLLLVVVVAGFDRVYRRQTDPRLPVELRLAAVAGPAARGESPEWRPYRAELRSAGRDTLWLNADGSAVSYLDCLLVDGVRRKTHALGCGTIMRRIPLPPGGTLVFPVSLRVSRYPHTLLFGFRPRRPPWPHRFAAWSDTIAPGAGECRVGLTWGSPDFE